MSTMSDEDRKALAKEVVNELVTQFRLNVGKSFIDKVWQLFIAICIAAVIYVAAHNGKI